MLISNNHRYILPDYKCPEDQTILSKESRLEIESTGVLLLFEILMKYARESE